LIIGFSVSWQLDKTERNDTAKLNKVIVFAEKHNDIKAPLIVEGDLIEPEKVKEQAQVQVKTKVTKDLDAITAEAYMVGDLNTGKVFLEHNISTVFPIASLSKFFTAIVAKNQIDKANKIIITKEMLDAYGEAGNLVKDEKFTSEELLYPLLLESSNDAAEALAQSFGYKKFIDAMNKLALDIGMKNTSFKDSSGLNSGNVSNVKDLFLLAQYYYKNEKDILSTTTLKEYTLATTTDHGFHHFVSINPFVVYGPFIGGKTGRTKEAKESMISLFELPSATTTRPVAVIILRSDMGEREMDTERIMGKIMNKI
jgi:D-alanyl-D-alanine carboxypeptidase